MITIKIDTGNDAFQADDEIMKVLQRIIRKLWCGQKEGTVMDSNGNTCGSYKLTNRPMRRKIS